MKNKQEQLTQVYDPRPVCHDCGKRLTLIKGRPLRGTHRSCTLSPETITADMIRTATPDLIRLTDGREIVRNPVAADTTALIARFQAAHKEFETAEKAIQEHYEPLVEAALENNDFKGAKALARQCPRESMTTGSLFSAIDNAILTAVNKGKFKLK